jgi:hypothetical protein
VTNLDLMHLTAEALHERAAYIVEHAKAIPVRVKLEDSGCFTNLILTELPARVAIREAFRLLLRAEVPHRRVKPEESEAARD